MRVIRIAALAGVLALAGAACSGSDSGGAVNTPPATTSGATAVKGTTANTFDPAQVEVGVGDTVSWSWDGLHNVVSKDEPPAFDSGDPANSGSFEHTFDEAGTYAYFCEVHGDTMSGTVVVS